jgi:hypothetical protein
MIRDGDDFLEVSAGDKDRDVDIYIFVVDRDFCIAMLAVL